VKRFVLLALLVFAVVALVQEARLAWERGKTGEAMGAVVATVIVGVVIVLWVRSMMRKA